jgi:hypothetical protein
MRFLYFYSPLYQFYHEHIQEALQDFFELEPHLIADIKELDNKDQHHFIGLTITPFNISNADYIKNGLFWR